jgi:hypothetical protein
MVSTYTTNGGIEKIGSGEQSGTWGTTTNTNFDIIDRLTNGVGAITLSGTTHTLTTSEGTLSDGMFKVLVLGGSPSGTNTITISPNTADKLYFVQNGTNQTATFSQGSGANVSIAAGKAAVIFADGAGSGAAVTDLSALFVVSSAIDGVNVGATTPGTGAFTALTVDNVVVNGANIGHTDDTDLITVANGVVTVAGEVSATTLDIGGTNITSTAAELNILDGVTATASELNIMDGVTATTAELNIMDGVTATASELNLLDGGTSVGSSITVADSDGIIVNDAGTMKTIPASAVKTYTTTGATSGTVTEVSTGQGLTGTVTSSGSVSMKNSWMSTSSAVFSISGTSFTNSRSYPVFISGRSAAGGGSFSFSVNNGSGGTGTIDMGDGDSGTNDPFAFILPVGGSISGSSFTGVGIELRPG